jgi:hypothetical protein
VNNQAFAAFPTMTVVQEHLPVLLFLIAIMAIALGVLIALFVLFRDQHRARMKSSKRFLLSNWK